MNDLREKIALVTGAGSPTGIGLASARALGRDGASLMLVSTTDRIHERAAELEKEGFHSKGYVASRSSLAAVNSSALIFEKEHC
jgi:3-oxoacyl-[acyl-carrier protein] reductase